MPAKHKSKKQKQKEDTATGKSGTMDRFVTLKSSSPICSVTIDLTDSPPCQKRRHQEHAPTPLRHHVMETTQQVRAVFGQQYGDAFVGDVLQLPDNSADCIIQALVDQNIPPSLEEMNRQETLPALSCEVRM